MISRFYHCSEKMEVSLVIDELGNSSVGHHVSELGSEANEVTSIIGGNGVLEILEDKVTVSDKVSGHERKVIVWSEKSVKDDIVCLPVELGGDCLADWKSLFEIVEACKEEDGSWEEFHDIFVFNCRLDNVN